MYENKLLSSKDFDNRLHDELEFNKLKELEKVSNKAIEVLKSLKGSMTEEEIKEKFPAYYDVGNYGVEQFIYVKFPTYKICLINYNLSEDDIKEKLKDVTDTRFILLRDNNNLILKDKLCITITIDISETELEKIKKKSNDVCHILNKCDIEYKLFSDYLVYPIKANKDKDGNITVIQK